ncbi:hypothetical protein Ciccas_005558 [Cichlidogyrus casuarinus]|uniref:Uncharacterized protein n=1 Tax=Cichlidogyrus casuarinus TaxID=1844966 RepID=A0ABD2Q8B6_9PLAT
MLQQQNTRGDSTTKKMNLSNRTLRPPQVFVSDENESIKPEQDASQPAVTRDSSFGLLEEESVLACLRLALVRMCNYLTCRPCLANIKIPDPVELRIRSQMWRLKKRQKLNYRKYPRLAWFIRICRQLPHLNTNQSPRASRNKHNRSAAPRKSATSSDAQEEQRTALSTEFTVEREKASPKRPRLQRQKIKTSEDQSISKGSFKVVNLISYSLLACSGSSRGGKHEKDLLQAPEQRQHSVENGYKKKGLNGSRRTLSGEAGQAKKNLSSTELTDQQSKKLLIEMYNKSTRTSTPSDMLITESFNSIEHWPGFLDMRKQNKQARQNASIQDIDTAVTKESSTVNRRSQFVDSKRRSALFLLERQQPDFDMNHKFLPDYARIGQSASNLNATASSQPKGTLFENSSPSYDQE